MAVLEEQDTCAHRFTLRPNCALSWRWAKRLFFFFVLCFAAVCWYFASLGAWLVLPFAGLELAALGGALYLSVLSGHTREVIEITSAEIRVLRGRRRLDQVARLSRHWAQTRLQCDPSDWYPSRLLLGCHGRYIEVGAKLVDAERKTLAAALQDRLGWKQPGRDTGVPEAAARALA